MEKGEEKYIKKFDEWNKRKKILNDKIIPDSLFFLEREIWWTSIGVNIGDEIDGKNENFERPILIVEKFDENNFIGIPMTSTPNKRGLFHSMIYKKEVYYISLKQVRYLNIKRLLRLIRRMDEAEFILIKDKIINIFS